MRRFFSPAIALMNRLGYTRKFMLLALVSAFAFATVAYSFHDFLNEKVRASQLELEGLALIEPISQTVQLIQRHRGLSAMRRGSNGAARDRLAANEKAVSAAFKAMEERLPPGIASGEDWLSIKKSWAHLQKEGLNWTAQENFVALSRLVEQLLFFEVSVADHYALTLDPQLDTYYLIDTSINKLPDMIEHLGQIRAYGIRILSEKKITHPDRVYLLNTIGKLNDALLPLNVNLKKTGRYNPPIQSLLATSSGEITGSVQQIIGIMTADILAERFTTPPDTFFASTTLAIDKAYAQMYEALLPTAKSLVEARIARDKNALHLSIGSAFVLLLIVAYFAAGIYYPIIGNIRSLARSARTFAGGNMSERVSLDTRDELGQIGDSFNEMADGFGAMHAARKQAELELRQCNEKLDSINRQLEETQNCLLQSERIASIRQLAVDVAHEINNPIGNVYSKLDLLEKYLLDVFSLVEQYEQAEDEIADAGMRAKLKAAKDRLDISVLKDDLRALMDESKGDITRVKGIVQNLKNFSHEWCFFDLHNGLDSTLNILNNEFKHKVVVVREYGDIPQVECLPSLLNQVFMNLLVNAAHAIEERGTITLRTGRQGDKVWIGISDTGKGIPAENMKQIFDPFFTTQPASEGKGLGLSLANGIVQKHHGRIEVQSAVGKGTTFRVWLPIKQPQDARM